MAQLSGPTPPKGVTQSESELGSDSLSLVSGSSRTLGLCDAAGGDAPPLPKVLSHASIRSSVVSSSASKSNSNSDSSVPAWGSISGGSSSVRTAGQAGQGQGGGGSKAQTNFMARLICIAATTQARLAGIHHQGKVPHSPCIWLSSSSPKVLAISILRASDMGRTTPLAPPLAAPDVTSWPARPLP